MLAIRHRYFGRLIISAILLSSAKLALETYFLSSPPNSKPQIVFTAFDYIFTFLFTVEALFKASALGFVIDQGAYLR